MNYKLLFILPIFLFTVLLTPSLASANISSPSYAWSESVGWIKFDSGVGAVVVSDSSLSGHAYNDNIGWIVLDGVTHNGAGTLSGYAWSESVGYIDFSDVTILNNQFYGYAYNDNIGFISFNCANTDTCGDVDYKVSTTWAPPVDAPGPSRSGGSSGSRRSPSPSSSPTAAPAVAVPTTSPTTTSPHLRASLTTPTQRNLTLNVQGQDVLNLQKFLNAQGFTIALSGAGSPGKETTYFGPLTRSALARFQAANGITPAVGYFGSLTRAFIARMQ